MTFKTVNRLADELDELLTGHERSTLDNALRVAARQYEKDALYFACLYVFGSSLDEPGSFVTRGGAYRLARQFKSQAEDVERLMSRIEGEEDDA